MRINSVEQKGYANGIMDWKIFVRQDLVVAKASEFFYEFVGENSFRPVSELLFPEDGELFKSVKMEEKHGAILGMALLCRISKKEEREVQSQVSMRELYN